MGEIIKKIQKIYYKSKKFKHLGNNVEIGHNVKFFGCENISIEDNVYIGPNSSFYGYGGITIKNGSILAHEIEIMTRNHNYDSHDLQMIPYDQRYIYKEVVIEENVWIGSNVLIVPGVRIGEGSVIGMGSVITKDVPKLSVVGGNPAKVIKYRNKEQYYKLKSDNKNYLEYKFKQN